MRTLATAAGPSPVRTSDRSPSRTNGPAAILAARTRDATIAAAITDWIADSLVDPQTGLIRDGPRINRDQSIHDVEPMTYTYCQSVYLGPCGSVVARRPVTEVASTLSTTATPR